MSETQKHTKRSEEIKRVAQAMRLRLSAFIAFLAAIVFILIFRIGETWWYQWMIDYRARIIGIILLIVVALIFLFPVIVEFTSNPRHLSGPGKPPPQSGWGI